MSFSEKKIHFHLLRIPPVLPVSTVTAQQGVPSLALAYLGAAIKKAGHHVSYTDALGENPKKFSDFGVDGLLAAGLSLQETIDSIPAECDLIGISCQFSNDWIYAKVIIEKIHQYFPRIPIICGGEHITADFENVLTTTPAVKICVLGEGEETLIQLISCLHENQNLQEVNGIAFIDSNGNLVKTNPRKRMAKIDELSWPDWTEMPLENYLSAGLGMAAQGLRTMPILASRGCPFKCTFCSAPQMWQARWFGRSIQDVVSEIIYYRDLYQIQHIEFYDMSSSVNKRWFEELVESMLPLGVSWNFPSGVRIENITPELLGKMKKSGCIKVTFALETSSERLIEKIKKRIDPLKMYRLIQAATKVGIIVKVNFIWGLPTQKVIDILQDYFFLIRLALAGLHDATCFAFVPYPGSEEFMNLRQNNKIPSDEKEYQNFLAFNVYNNPMRMRSWSDEIPDWQMKYWTLGGMTLFYGLQFLVRPWRFVQLIYRIKIGKPITMLELALASLINGFIKGRKTRKVHSKQGLEPVFSDTNVLVSEST